MTRVYRFEDGGAEILDSIRPLWEELNRHHASVSTYFSEIFRNGSFERRKADFVCKAERGMVRVDVCLDGDGLAVGFCAGTIMDHVGEIESLYVSPAHRGKKLGEELLKRLMDWFSGNGAASVEVRVAVGNESTHALYRKFGFYPRQTVLTKR